MQEPILRMRHPLALTYDLWPFKSQRLTFLFSLFLEGRASWSHTASAGVLGFNTLHFHTAGVRSNVAEDDQNTTLSLS